MPVLDTNFLIALHDRDPRAEAVLAGLRGQALLVPSIVAVEFVQGLASPEHGQSELQAGFTVVHTTTAWIATAAAHRRRLRREGKKIRAADSWIAAWALLEDTFVVTRNRADFEAMHIQTRQW
jgi:predicted nucleic acid-binding protein